MRVMKLKFQKYVFAFLTTIFMAACGGGSSSSSGAGSTTGQNVDNSNPNQSTEGYWIGKGKTRTDYATESTVFSFVTPGGDYFHLYSAAQNKPVEIWYGTKLISTGETWSSNNALPASIIDSAGLVVYDWAHSTRISGSVTSKKTMTAKVMSGYYGGTPYAQELASITTSVYQSSYESVAKQSNVIGSYAGKIIIPQSWGMVGDDGVNITVSNTGKLLGNYWGGACQITGQITAGSVVTTNTYTVTINPLSCDSASVGFTGYATFDTDSTTNRKRLIVFAKRDTGGVNERSNGFGGIFILN